MTSEYRLLEVEWLKNMWRPDSFFKNAKSVTFQTMTIPNHYMWLYKDKTILYMVKLTLRLSCAMNFIIYPHDTQECKLQMESCKLCARKLLKHLIWNFSCSNPKKYRIRPMTWSFNGKIWLRRLEIVLKVNYCSGIPKFHLLLMIILNCRS